MSDEHQVSQDELKREVSNEDRYFRKLEEDRLAAAERRIQVRKLVCRRPDRPQDGCELQTVSLEGVEVERCEVCGGVWLDAHELEELQRRSVKKQPGLWEKFVHLLVPQDEPKG